LESTYGIGFTRQGRDRPGIVENHSGSDCSSSQGGHPAFAVERTQDIIYTLGRFIRKGAIPPIPIYIDSPLAISATEIFKRNSDCFDQETKALLSGGENPLDIPASFTPRPPKNQKPLTKIRDLESLCPLVDVRLRKN